MKGHIATMTVIMKVVDIRIFKQNLCIEKIVSSDFATSFVNSPGGGGWKWKGRDGVFLDFILRNYIY